MAKRLDAYNITAKLTVLAGITIKAESYEDAVARSKELDETDFITFKDEFVDGKMEISNISRSGSWDLDR